MSDHINILSYGPIQTRLVLRDFADRVKTFLELLKALHPAFDVQYYVFGDKANLVFPVESDLSNLHEIIFQWAWDKRDKREGKYKKSNVDGTPSWDTPATGIGYAISLGTNEKGEFGYKHGGVDLRISIGGKLPNTITIGLPLPSDPLFLNKDIYELHNIRKLSTTLIEFWRPWYLRVSDTDFMDVVDFEYGSDLYRENYSIGWMTYIRRKQIKNCLHEDIKFEEVSDGVLFWLNDDIRTIIGIDESVVDKAIQIRDCLLEKGKLKEIKSDEI